MLNENIFWTFTFIFTTWISWIYFIDSYKFFSDKSFFKTWQKLNIYHTILGLSPWKHQLSVKNLISEKLFPHWIHFWIFVKSYEIILSDSFLLFDFFQLLIGLYKFRTHLLLNEIKMRFFGKRKKVFCPITINFSLIIVLFSFWISWTFYMIKKFLNPFFLSSLCTMIVFLFIFVFRFFWNFWVVLRLILIFWFHVNLMWD